MVIMQLEFFLFCLAVSHMTEKDSFTERVLKVLTLQAANQTALLKGETLFSKKMREIKFSADVIL